MSDIKASSWPGAVGGNAPGDPLALCLRGRGGITGAGLWGSLPACSLRRGRQARTAGAAHITTGLLLMNQHFISLREEEGANAKMTIRTRKQQKKTIPNTVTEFDKHLQKKNSPHQSLLNILALHKQQAWANCLSKNQICDTKKDFKDRRRQALQIAKPEYCDEAGHLVPVSWMHSPNHNRAPSRHMPLMLTPFTA